MNLQILLFKLDNQQYGIDILLVEHILWAVEITPIPHVEEEILGFINVHGKVITVVDVRKILGLNAKALDISNRIIILKIESKTIGLIVDEVVGLKEITTEEKIAGDTLFSHLDDLDTVIKMDNEMIFIYKWEKIIPHYEPHVAIDHD